MMGARGVGTLEQRQGKPDITRTYALLQMSTGKQATRDPDID